MYSACCCCALSMVENESRNIFFDVFPMFQIEFRLNLLSLFNLKKKKLKKRKRWWGRHELAIVHKSNPVCVTIGRSVILCCAWCFSSQSRARFYFSLLVFFFLFFWRRRVQYYYTAGPRRNLYDQIIGEEGQGQRGRIDGTPSAARNTVYSVVHDGRESLKRGGTGRMTAKSVCWLTH